MNVKELKKILNEFPEDMEIGGSGHFGEILELRGLEVYGIDPLTKTDNPYVKMDIEWAGPDPSDHWD